MSRLKKLFAPLALLVAALAFFFGRRTNDKGLVKKANEAATAAKVDAIEAKADLEKEKINNEAQQKLDDLANTSDDELAAAISAEYHNRAGAKAGGPVEDSSAGG